MENKNYPGQKNIPGLIQKIINNIPECSVFYELYAGSAEVSKIVSVGSTSKPMIFLNDINPDVNTYFTVLQGAIFSNKDALDLLQSKVLSLASTDTFIFIDPPYLHTTRPNNTRLYKFEMTQEQHEQMLLAVLELNCNIMVIHPDCELYNKYLCTYRQVKLKIRYNNKTSIEKLYMNYPLPDKLQVKQYTGADCWDRQRIKRKGDRLIEKINKLPGQEKQYILNRIKQQFQTLD